MRIIDKNTDFYDYLSNLYRDDYYTFDRRNSFILKKERVLNTIDDRYSSFLLLQIGSHFWLFNIEPIKNKNDYNLKLRLKWKDCIIPRKLIDAKIIVPHYMYGINNPFLRRELSNADIVDMIRNSNYTIFGNLNIQSPYGKDQTERIPILKECGLAKLIDPSDIYFAIEEYFALQKQDNERTESIGLTNTDKISNHGFDIKTSFRGKVKRKKERI